MKPTEYYELRIKCLELALEHHSINGGYETDKMIVNMARTFEDYIFGVADQKKATTE